MRVIKQEFISNHGLVRVSLHTGTIFDLGPALTGNDLVNANVQHKDLEIVNTIVHVKDVCSCVSCQPVWSSLDKEYVFD